RPCSARLNNVLMYATNNGRVIDGNYLPIVELSDSVIFGGFNGEGVSMTFSNCIWPNGGISLHDVCIFRRCIIGTQLLLNNQGHVTVDCIVRDIVTDPNSTGNVIKNCATFGQGRPPEGSENSFLTNPRFLDPANLDYRLAPNSPCKGKASDGGDIGCRYTPEMIELCKVALELRRRGIIKF
ncbi:MAG: hypothetical protein ACUVUC_13240, partial [Thermoguttaceae bacterium]